MSSFLISSYKEISIDDNLIEEFEENAKEEKYDSLEFLLDLIIQERKTASISFTGPEYYSRFLKLSSNISPQYKSVLSFFRKSQGLPENLFDKDVALRGTNGASIDCSKELLESFSDFFKVGFRSGFKEGQKNEEKYSMSLQLGQKALDCFKTFLFTKKVHFEDKKSLEEIIEFAEMTGNSSFQKHVAKAVFAYFLDDKNRIDFDATLIGDQADQFTGQAHQKLAASNTL